MRNLGRNGGFTGELGAIGCWWRLPDSVLVPTKCLPVNARQTHRVQRQEKVSPNAKKAYVYGTSWNISQQRSGIHRKLQV